MTRMTTELRKALEKDPIVKVQLPLMSGEPSPKALVYNKSGTFVVMTEVGGLEIVMEGTLKGFFKASYDSENNITNFHGDPLSDQGW